MKFYRAVPVNTIPAGQGGADGADPAVVPLGAAAIIAIRAADLVPPCGGPPAEGDRTALVLRGTPQIRTGEQLLFVKVVAVARAVARRRRPDPRPAAIPPIMPGWARWSSSLMSWRDPG